MLFRAIMVGFSLFVLGGEARAQTLIFPNFASATGLSLNDASTTAAGSILLASSQNDRRGSFFTTTQYAVTGGFSAVFEFRISSPGGVSDGTAAGADGLAFVIQRSGASALGGTGEGLGYGPRGGTPGIATSLAVEFDTFRNSWDPSSNHLGINTGGALTSLATADVAAAFDNGIKWTAWVDYDGAKVSVRLSQDGIRPALPTLDYTLNLLTTLGGTSAFIGFTGATGSAFGTHEVLGFAFSDSSLAGGIAAIPEPSTYALCGLGLVMILFVAWRRRR